MNELYDGVHASDNYMEMVMSQAGLPYNEQVYTEKATVDAMKLAWAQAYAEDVQRRNPQARCWRFDLKDYRFERTCKVGMGAHICHIDRFIFFGSNHG